MTAEARGYFLFGCTLQSEEKEEREGGNTGRERERETGREREREGERAFTTVTSCERYFSY